MLQCTRTLASSLKAKPGLSSTTRFLSTATEPQTKARGEQTMEQAHSTPSPAYKTIKEKEDADQDTVRFAWLAQQPHAGNLLSLQTQPWVPSHIQEGRNGEMAMTTVWPHLW